MSRWPARFSFTWVSECHQTKGHVVVGSSRSKRRTLGSRCRRDLVFDHLPIQSYEAVPKTSAGHIKCVLVIEPRISTSRGTSGSNSQTRRKHQVTGIRGRQPIDR